jgi:hypothetical protein
MDRLAQHHRRTRASLIEAALVEFAQRHGGSDAPPIRTPAQANQND